MRQALAIDVGGTNIKIALVDFDGKIAYSNTVPTRAEMGFEAGVANIKQAIKDLMQETNQDNKTIEAIGFGLPGQIDYKSGMVKNLPNIPGWINRQATIWRLPFRWHSSGKTMA